ncbi:hypothetical protein BVG79_01453 [Ketogulonicigenium robustum]|uniref:DUF4177 domain-containing protein n=1 Tax=Ketogulonicigenium robustum TaxID=92947 RepID=A0A1W6P028_9RHOB|nr:DUF4177 domain-containing protein [Ketogulonicigenium robustum]ARO14799.1 hypothetical protein BVG79_01453 [Ketogulonicigenium robustum]
MTFEYRVVAAPRRAEKHRGAKSTEDRFTRTLEVLMNEMAADGWDYQRAESLPCEERHGLTGRTTVYQSVLVFRRPVAAPQQAPAIAPTAPASAVPAPTIAAPKVADAPAAQPRVTPSLGGAALGGATADEPPLKSAIIPPLKAD